jgi:hypothetical protein
MVSLCWQELLGRAARTGRREHRGDGAVAAHSRSRGSRIARLKRAIAARIPAFRPAPSGLQKASIAFRNGSPASAQAALDTLVRAALYFSGSNSIRP